ncbi:hypothetical protein CUS_6261 [Ruminococcus albus 8]|uniref:Uncharacterized protein n=1 Tax=Ruminococcus albus 8 TaxID=246199 RepID=E9S9E8_RUMAL|nr:hypothetical protein CUS_6261 [Ruminococcus albus 8]
MFTNYDMCMFTTYDTDIKYHSGRGMTQAYSGIRKGTTAVKAIVPVG